MAIPQLDFGKYIPGFSGLTSAASGNIGAQLSGLPSTGRARTKAAYFGATSGMPNSGVSNAFGMDLYGQEAEQQKQQGFENLLKMLTGYSGTVAPTVGQQIQDTQFGADLDFRKIQADAQNKLQQQQQNFAEEKWGKNRLWSSDDSGRTYDRTGRDMGFQKRFVSPFIRG